MLDYRRVAQLSPFQFITFMDRISMCSQWHDGFWFREHSISSLLFADYVVPFGFNNLEPPSCIDAASAKCEVPGMTVCTTVSEAMIFTREILLRLLYNCCTCPLVVKRELSQILTINLHSNIY